MIAILVIDHGSRYSAANEALFDVVNLLQKKCPDYLVKGAHMELESPSIEDGYRACIDDGATHIIAHPYMLSPGRHAMRDIPNMVAEIALSFPNVSYEVTLPLGLDEHIVDVIMHRCGVSNVH